jgi:ArsR family transcriptional regulator
MSNKETSEIARLAAAFAALSNPQRLRMFIKLATSCCAPERRRTARGGRQFCCASEVGAGLDMAASTASHHMKELRQAGLMHVERHGQRIDCWASEETLALLASFFATWARKRSKTKRKPKTGAAAERKGAR